jgi:apolipoprotein N-acyltransferase
MGKALAWFLFALFCLAKALQTGVFATLAGSIARRWFAIPAIAAIWTAIEWTHSWTGFEWLNLGNAGIDMPLLLRLAPVTGVWGISFALVVISAVVAALVTKTQKHPAIWLLALPSLMILPGLPDNFHPSQEAVIVQPNIDDETVWTQELLNQTERQMRIFSLSVSGRNHAASIVVWPEVPAPFYDGDPAFADFLAEIARQAQAGVLAGVVAHESPRGAPLNSALLIGEDGNRISRYDKVNLVPFGEFVPWPFGLVTEKVSTEAGDFAPGKNVVVSNLGGHKIGAFICYESAFPSYVRQFAASGAQALFNISNDSWFGKTAARYQHLMLVRMRAVENDRWIVRSTNNGISGIVDPSGQVKSTLPEYQESSARVPYDYVGTTTFYTRYSDWFVLLCALTSAAALIAEHRSAPESLR